jgi:hypothetical protein
LGVKCHIVLAVEEHKRLVALLKSDLLFEPEPKTNLVVRFLNFRRNCRNVFIRLDVFAVNNIVEPEEITNELAAVIVRSTSVPVAAVGLRNGTVQ